MPPALPASKRLRASAEFDQRIIARLDLLAEATALGLEIFGCPNSKGWITCRAVGREDNTPSAGFNTLTGRYSDRGGESENVSFFDMAVKLGNGRWKNWNEARDHFAYQVGLVPDTPNSPYAATPHSGKDRPGRPRKATVTATPNQNGNHTAAPTQQLSVFPPAAPPPKRDPAAHLVFNDSTKANERVICRWCKTKLGMTPESVVAFGGRLARYREAFSVIAFPICGPDLNHANAIGWVLFEATGGELPIFIKGGETQWRKMKTTGGSEGGLLGAFGVDGQPTTTATVLPANATIWKTEGPTDALALWGRIPAIERPANAVMANSGGAGEFPKPWILQLFRGRCVNVVHDCDIPGQGDRSKPLGEIGGAYRWCRKLAEDESAVIKNIRLPSYPIAKDHGKDLRDWVNDGHTFAELKALAAAAAVTPCERQVLEADDDPHRLADLFRRAQLHPEGLKFWRGEWWEFSGKCYRPVSKDEINSRLTASVKAEFNRIYFSQEQQFAAGNWSKKDPPVARSINQQLTGNVRQALQSLCFLQEEIEWGTWLDLSIGTPGDALATHNWIAVNNGLLDLSALLADADQCLRPHSPDWFSPICLPGNFNPEAKCPTWDEVLAVNLDRDHQRMDVAQEWAGYLLTPNTDMQKFMILTGDGGTGKSVFCAGMVALLGEKNVASIPLEMFSEKFSLASTIGKLANIVAEVSELDKVDEGILKSFVSGDRMTFDRKFLSQTSAIPTARMMIATNRIPSFSDKSDGVWRRMIIVPFNRQVADHERRRNMDKPWFWKKELDGILSWALVGLARLKENKKFSFSSTCDEILKEQKNSANPARIFLLENFESTDSESHITTEAIHRQYQEWCRKLSYNPMNSSNLGREIARVFPHAKKSMVARKWGYRGLNQLPDF